ncbi:DUF427 domain-containing protein [Halomonas caseinilytica]|uniref:DUF427 domain-containing protein n=1 Tax=Halomonas caseinilytica TaxID=438744 RepID=UPI0008488845|nr:DUF427 domain-containing protein [Halomonas caseinilytica]
MANLTASRITLHLHARRGRIYHCDILLADTRDGIELHEKDYPQRQYIPKADVDMSRFTVSTTVAHCPFKGESTHGSLSDITDVAWSYEHPIGEMAAIADRLPFDSNKVPELVQ